MFHLSASSGRDTVIRAETRPWARGGRRRGESEQESGAAGTVVWHAEEHERGRTEEEENGAKKKEAGWSTQGPSRVTNKYCKVSGDRNLQAVGDLHPDR